MLWVKALHIVFVASWFAGLFYLPRIFVNLAMVPPGSVAERERLLLIAYHAWCGRLLAQFMRGEPGRSHVWFRWFNEAPVLMLLVSVVLVVVKPF